MEQLLIKGGRVVDPSSSLDGKFDVLLKGDKIEAVEKPGAFDSLSSEVRVVDAAGKVVAPGLIDIHVHLREPGEEWKETVESGARAAAAGGFTSVCCMPNTKPINDDAQVTKFILSKAEEADAARVHPIGAITKGSKGKSLAPMLELRDAGCVAFSDDGLPVADAGVMRKALEYSKMTDCVLTVHEEEKQLSQGFSMNESALSLRLGLIGMPGAAEEVMISRDIELSRLTGARVHFCHVSTERGATLIRRAKEDGIRVTAEVTPHHLHLDESAVSSFDSAYKMSMPLRAIKDREALLKALSEGVIDCVASDHAPHEADSKRVEFDHASFGLVGLQTTLPLLLEKVREGSLSLSRAIESLTSSPRRCFNLTPVALVKGSVADITIIDLEREETLSSSRILSKSKNTPFLGRSFQGHAAITIVGGQVRYQFEEEDVS